ncbi:MAG: type II secretion system protein [Candidatus Marinimicrobia bacterium]|nr:type II secretion system protein [Candidatus Neomarinimicrobiota bacterium]
MQSRRSSPAKPTEAGFTLIEVVIGLLIIAMTASTVFYGVSYARAEIRKIAIRERALEELGGYMDYWIALINYGQMSVNDKTGDNRGEEVIIYNPTGIEDEAIVAKIYREPFTAIYSDEYNPLNDPYYHLKCRIVWEDHLADNEMTELYLETKTFSF